MGKREPPPAQGPGWSVVRLCPRCQEPDSSCRCPEAASDAPAGKPTVRLRLERRNGKPLTVLAASDLDPAALASIHQQLKTRCGAGGTLRGNEAEIQGDHREKARAFLRQQGVSVKG